MQLFGSILESFRKDFHLASETRKLQTYCTGSAVMLLIRSDEKKWVLFFFLDIILFPYFLYPVNQVAISGSIFMTVAIAWERYVAVHYPIDYNQAMNDVNSIRKRLLKYVGPCFVLALVFNVPKFFEVR